MEALDPVAAQVGEPVQRGGILDALGDDREPEVVREVDRGANDDQVARVA